MIFKPTHTCRDCDEPIMLIDGEWCDRTITEGARPWFATLCEAALRHMPKEEEIVPEVRGVYLLHARNLRIGVWNGHSWIGIRTKFGDRFLEARKSQAAPPGQPGIYAPSRKGWTSGLRWGPCVQPAGSRLTSTSLAARGPTCVGAT